VSSPVVPELVVVPELKFSTILLSSIDSSPNLFKFFYINIKQKKEANIVSLLYSMNLRSSIKLN